MLHGTVGGGISRDPEGKASRGMYGCSTVITKITSTVDVEMTSFERKLWRAPYLIIKGFTRSHSPIPISAAVYSI